MTLPQSRVAEITLSYYPNIKLNDCEKVSSSKDAERLFRENWDDAQIGFVEEFKVMLLNRANRVLGISAISKGGVTGTVVDPKIVYGLALKAVACGIILAHNHPSGNLKPSHADIKLTEKLASAGKIFDLPILDHLIMTSESYYSFTDNGEPCLS
ncbi:MAG: DNA repair protein [Cytophagales bacterium CG17_big_fil_post_rev_8_21_14_2_50_40_13]|nr:MAG: DNA repair protein [Cytophagales bacterium CG17_big_fil_post_rev_8_21_14_2_50_40_13]